jgi:hypothetical protein
MSSTARRRRSRGRGVGSRSGKAEPYRTAGGKAAGEIIGRQSRGKIIGEMTALATFHTFRAYNTVRSAPPSSGRKTIPQPETFALPTSLTGVH